MRSLVSDKKQYALRYGLMVLIGVMAVVVFSSSAFATRYSKPRAQQADRYASIVMEAGSGIILSQKNADKKLYPASLTKMMTLYLVFEAIEDGRLSKSERIPVSRYAQRQVPSRLGVRAGYTLRVEDAILGLVTKSANDAAVALAEAVAGSEAGFARKMTQKARALGMENSNFVNASGLHSPRQFSTARDMAVLSRSLIRDFPRHYGYFSTQSFTYAGYIHKNHNKLMNSYTGMDGLKTGYVYASGYNLAASAVRDGHRLIGVVFGGKTAGSRNREMARLLDTGFENMQDPRVAYKMRKNWKSVEMAMARTPVKVVSADSPSPALLSNISPAAGSFPAPEIDAEGDADDSAEAATVIKPVKPVRGNNIQVKNKNGVWAVQIGAFASSKAGMTALSQAQKKLSSKQISADGRSVVVPLKTSRGLIYRARLAGLDRGAADDACRLLKGSCLVLAMK